MSDERILFGLLRGGALADRVYPMIAPMNVVTPFAVYTLSSASPETYLDAGGNLDRRVCQVDYYATTFDQAKELADAGRLLLEAQNHVIIAERHDFEQSTERYRISLDVSLWLNR
jgi:hypothetical protein